MFVHVPSPHTYFLPPDSPNWEFVYLVVCGRELLRIIFGIERRLGNVLAFGEESGIPAAFLAVLKALFAATPLSPFEISIRSSSR